jgi:rhodanese-related sulfurtransferase
VSGETLARAWAPVEVTGAGVPEVTVAWVAENLSAGRIVDVREATEFNAELGHITGAELVPLSTVDDVVKHWDREAPTVLVCRSGGRSGKAALAMLRLGFTRVASMRGGMIAWNERRLPVARV